MKTKALALALLATANLAAGPALAHHSFAAVYDADKEVTIEGKVMQFQYRNPHSVVHVLVKDSDAATKLVPEILRLCADTHTLQQMQQSVSRAARPEATAAIVNEVEKIWKH